MIRTNIGFIVSAFALAVPCSAADIGGRVTFASGKPARDAVVYLQGSETSTPLASTMIDQRDKTFTPHVMVITCGTTVRFPNNDTVFHNVFAYYQAKKFDLGMYPRGASKSVKFDKPGLVAILCNVHSEMSAYIMVVDTPYYATTDAHGKFHISHVAPGTYTLHGWQESGTQVSRPVTITESDDSMTVSLGK